jgi:hypothetical protein
VCRVLVWKSETQRPPGNVGVFGRILIQWISNTSTVDTAQIDLAQNRHKLQAVLHMIKTAYTST